MPPFDWVQLKVRADGTAAQSVLPPQEAAVTV